MRLTLNEFLALTKTKSEPSSVVEGLWISRSILGLKINNKVQPIFGFGAAFEREKCEKSSVYELLEHLAFLPGVYKETNLNKLVASSTGESAYIYQFLTGSPGPHGVFYGNGCAISYHEQDAVTHATREILERHLCCEIWYKRSRPLFQKLEYKLNILIPSVEVNFYSTNITGNDHFVMASLTCSETGFFAIGSAIKSTEENAYKHAAGEVIMIFEDARKARVGISSTENSRKNILSLREKSISLERKKYFYSLLSQQNANYEKNLPICDNVLFEPLPGVYASRSFSCNALDPRNIQPLDSPVLPLF